MLSIRNVRLCGEIYLLLAGTAPWVKSPNAFALKASKEAFAKKTLMIVLASIATVANASMVSPDDVSATGSSICR